MRQSVAAVAQDNAVFCRVTAAVTLENHMVEFRSGVHPPATQNAGFIASVNLCVERSEWLSP